MFGSRQVTHHPLPPPGTVTTQADEDLQCVLTHAPTWFTMTEEHYWGRSRRYEGGEGEEPVRMIKLVWALWMEEKK